ncbi:MAG UNVERIFIED_CONTAM: transglutaminase-like domain-containing protein [Planctomycetaceae bacterium]
MAARTCSCATLLIARIDNPDVDPPVYIARLDLLAEEIRSKLPADAPPAARLAELDRLLFQELGVRGSRQEYESPSNSYLNEVIDDREGIPISLSVLYMELARRLNLNVVGVGLPGHFVVRYEPGGSELPQTIDVFERGKRLSEEEIRAILAAARFPDEPRFREAAGTSRIIERMLMNLLGIAEGRRDDDQVHSLLETLASIFPENVEYRAKRLEMRARTGRVQMAIDDADWFIKTQPDGVDVERVRQLRQTLEEQLPSGRHVSWSVVSWSAGQQSAVSWSAVSSQQSAGQLVSSQQSAVSSQRSAGQWSAVNASSCDRVFCS